MILYFDQRISTWTSQFDILQDSGEFYCRVQGKLSAAAKFLVLDAYGSQLGSAEEKVLSAPPLFSLKHGMREAATIRKKGLFKPSYEMNNGWTIQGDIGQWDWTILTRDGSEAARMERKRINGTMRYTITTAEEINPLTVILTILAVDTQRCSHGTIRRTIRKRKENIG